MTSACPCLWLAPDVAPRAVELYTRLIPNSRVVSQHHFENPTPENSADTWSLEVAGSPLRIMGAANNEQPTMASSVWLVLDDQAQLDAVWQGFLDAGGAEMQCGWLTDPFGVAWQIVPATFERLTESGDDAQAQRVVEAVWRMTKIDAAALDAAARG